MRSRQHGDALDLDVGAQGQLLRGHAAASHGTSVHHRRPVCGKGEGGRKRNARPTRLFLAPVLRVDLVHGREVLHVGEEHVDLDDVIDGRARGLEHVGQVLDALVLP